MRARRTTLVALTAVLLAVGACASAGAGETYNTTDPTVFAPHCLNPLHRNHKHCLDGATVGGVTLNGSSHTIDPGTGERYTFRLTTPPHCVGTLKKGMAPCTTAINWGVLYGASLADWGNAVSDTVEAQSIEGCGGNDRTCSFVADYSTPAGPALPNGTALRVTAVAEVVGLPCGKAKLGYCEHWADWQLRLSASSPTLEVDWSMPSRLTDARARSFSDSSYGLGSSAYTDPPGWDVSLFLTDGSRPVCPSGKTYRWTLSGNGETMKLPGDGCKVSATVERLGTYSVTAEELKGGVPDGTKAANEQVVVRDWLIVALGDSNGSGQANPPYLYPQCDRSVVSYQFQTAQYIEDHDPRSSVTFLWASCSGARSDQLWRNTYEGQEPGQGTTLPPQLDQIHSRLVPGNREVDAVVMSVGINDLFFGQIMGFCTTYDTPAAPKALWGPSCEDAHVAKSIDSQGYVEGYSQSRTAGDPTLEQETADRVKELPTAFRLLDKQLQKIDPAHVFATQYPDETTDSDGSICDGKGSPPRLPSTVWSWLKGVGAQLNGAVGKTSSLGWTPVTGIAQEFTGHGYCSPETFFRTVAQSVISQHNPFGSFHANPAGQAITFHHTRDTVCQALYGNPACDGSPK